jgi:hypothetical protein
VKIENDPFGVWGLEKDGAQGSPRDGNVPFFKGQSKGVFIVGREDFRKKDEVLLAATHDEGKQAGTADGAKEVLYLHGSPAVFTSFPKELSHMIGIIP